MPRGKKFVLRVREKRLQVFFTENRYNNVLTVTKIRYRYAHWNNYLAPHVMLQDPDLAGSRYVANLSPNSLFFAVKHYVHTHGGRGEGGEESWHGFYLGKYQLLEDYNPSFPCAQRSSRLVNFTRKLKKLAWGGYVSYINIIWTTCSLLPSLSFYFSPNLSTIKINCCQASEKRKTFIGP